MGSIGCKTRRLVCSIALIAGMLGAQAQGALALGSMQVNDPSSADQARPAVYGDRVVWEDQSGYDHIDTKNVATGVQELVSNTSNQYNRTPDIYQDRIVWADGDADISMKDMSTGFISKMTVNGDLQWNPATSGSRVVWSDYRAGGSNSDIWMRTIGGAEAAVITHASGQFSPAVSGDKVVWEDNRTGNWDIWMKNLTSGTYSAVITMGGTQSDPAISGNFVAWQDKRGSTYDIYVKNLSTGSTSKIAGDQSKALAAAASAGSGLIQVSSTGGLEAGDRLLIDEGYETAEWVTIYSISGNTLTLTSALSDSHPLGAGVEGAWDQSQPSIYSSGSTYKLVWQDLRKGDYDVYMYNSATGATTAIAKIAGSNQVGPKVQGSTVVWADDRSGNSDIYLAATAPIVTDDGAWTNSTDTLHAGWNYLGGASEYRYAIGTTPGGTTVRGWTSAGTSMEVTATGLSLVSGQAYYFSVKAVDGGVESEVGTSDGIEVDTVAPGAPTGVTGTAGDTTATVRWNAVSDALSGLDHYIVYRKVGGGSYSAVGNTTSLSYNDNSLVNGTTYSYKISALDNAGNEGAQSSEVSVVPKQAGPVVTDDGAWTRSTSTLHATWTTVPGASEYQYAIGTSPGATNTVTWTTTLSTEVTATPLTLVPGQTYYFSVAGAVAGSQMSQVGSSNGITVDNAGPTAPTGVMATAGDTTATVRWNASVDPTSGVDHYVVKRSEIQGGPYSQIGTAAGLSYNDSGLTNGTTYYYVVSAVDNAGNGGPQSDEASTQPGDASTISITPTATIVLYGAKPTFEGTISPAPAAGTTVTIYADPHPYSAAAPAVEATTDAGGHYRATVPAAPLKHTQYFARWVGDARLLGADSVRAQIRVRVKVMTYRLRSVVRRSLGQTQVLTGRMWPKHYGKVLLYVQRKNSRGQWVKAAYVYLSLRNYWRYSYSYASYTYRPYYRGSYRAWVRYLGDTNHLGNNSPQVTFAVW